jgi:hypothetical protein
MMQTGDLSVVRGVIGQTATNVTLYRQSMYNMRMDPTMTGSDLTFLRIDTTEEGTMTLAGGRKKDRGTAVGHTTADYP